MRIFHPVWSVSFKGQSFIIVSNERSDPHRWISLTFQKWAGEVKATKLVILFSPLISLSSSQKSSRKEKRETTSSCFYPRSFQPLFLAIQWFSLEPCFLKTSKIVSLEMLQTYLLFPPKNVLSKNHSFPDIVFHCSQKVRQPMTRIFWDHYFFHDYTHSYLT